MIERTQFVLPFMYDDNIDDLESCIISIEFSLIISGHRKYCYASYYANSLYFDELSNKLKNAPDKVARIELINKNSKTTDFKISLESISEFFADERFNSLELLCKGINDKSYREFNFEII